jgi:hypothetical protein
VRLPLRQPLGKSVSLAGRGTPREALLGAANRTGGQDCARIGLYMRYADASASEVAVLPISLPAQRGPLITRRGKRLKRRMDPESERVQRATKNLRAEAAPDH